MTWLDEVGFDEDGLVAAIAQDAVDGRVLMLAWMDREALRLTAESGEAVYYSRSRKRLWRKGESSGHVQRVRDIRLDCDGDAVLLAVPLRPLCREGCLGLCAACGADLNTGACPGHDDEQHDQDHHDRL